MAASNPFGIVNSALRGGRRSRSFGMPLKRPTIVQAEQLPQFWHPDRGVTPPTPVPAWFTEAMREVHPDLAVAWNPRWERWAVWVKEPTVTHRLCPGWRLVFLVGTADGDYRPLDQRVLAKLYDRSPKKWGNAKQYFDALMAAQAREKASADRAWDTERDAIAGDEFDHSKIQVAMCGASNGSKFADFNSE